MEYLIADRNTLAWLMFALYAVSALFIIPNRINARQAASIDAVNDLALQFASRFILRIALIFPLLFVIKNTI